MAKIVQELTRPGEQYDQQLQQSFEGAACLRASSWRCAREDRVGTKVRVATRPPKFRCRRDQGNLDRQFAWGDPPDRWFSSSILVPKRTLSTGGICPPRSLVFIVLFENARQSEAQLLSIIAHRSNVSIYYVFAPGPPKPPRNSSAKEK